MSTKPKLDVPAYFDKRFEYEMRERNTIELLVEEVNILKNKVDIQATDIYYLNQKLVNMSKMLMDYNYLFKTISKDYPELVLAKPEIFLTSEKKES